MRTIVIGDVHGCLDEFRELLKLLSFSKGRDRLVSVGDLVDRGPDSVGCVRFARECGATVVMGNHEEKHIRWRKHEAVRKITGKKNPMRPFPPERAAENAAFTDEEMEWMANLPMTLNLENGMVVVHGGLEPMFSFEDQKKGVLRVRFVDETGKFVGWKKGSRTPRRAFTSLPKKFFDSCPSRLLPAFTREATLDDAAIGMVYWTELWKGPESVIYGHAVADFKNPRIDRFPGGCCYGIDTGCAYGGPLTAMVLPQSLPTDPEFVQVYPKKVYFNKVCIGDD